MLIQETVKGVHGIQQLVLGGVELTQIAQVELVGFQRLLQQVLALCYQLAELFL